MRLGRTSYGSLIPLQLSINPMFSLVNFHKVLTLLKPVPDQQNTCRPTGAPLWPQNSSHHPDSQHRRLILPLWTLGKWNHTICTVCVCVCVCVSVSVSDFFLSFIHMLPRAVHSFSLWCSLWKIHHHLSILPLMGIWVVLTLAAFRIVLLWKLLV